MKILNSDYEHHLVPSQDIHITIIALQTTTENQSLVSRLLREAFDSKTIRDALKKDDKITLGGLDSFPQEVLYTKILKNSETG